MSEQTELWSDTEAIWVANVWLYLSLVPILVENPNFLCTCSKKPNKLASILRNKK